MGFSHRNRCPMKMATPEVKLCFQCDVNPRMREDFLCKSCKLDHKMCYECGEKERNHPFKLCTDCHRARRTERDGVVMSDTVDLTTGTFVNHKLLNRLQHDQNTYKEIAEHFKKEWVKTTPTCPTPPAPLAIYAIQNKRLIESFHEYSDRIKHSDQHPTNSDQFFHGTKLTCNLLVIDDCCDDGDCGICGITKNGFDPRRIGTNIPRFQRFGRGIYLAPNSSKCHDYTQGDPFHGVRAQLLCLVACGAKFELLHDNTKLSSPPDQFHSVYGKSGGSLNYDEIVVFDADAVMPQFVIVYQLNGVDKIAK